MSQAFPIGLSSSMLLDYSLEEAVGLIRAWNYPHIEVWGDYPHAHPDTLGEAERRALRQLLRPFDRVSIHAPLGGASLASMNPGIWREATREYLETVRLAAEIGAETVVVHPGEVRDWRLDKIAREHCVAALCELAEEATRRGVRLALENNGPYLASLDRTADELISLLDEVHSPSLLGCLDTGHGNVNRNNAELVQGFGARLIHLHVHDNHGERDEHLPMGWGTIDFGFLAPALEHFDGMVIAELTWNARSPGTGAEAMARAAQSGWNQFWRDRRGDGSGGTDE